MKYVVVIAWIMLLSVGIVKGQEGNNTSYFLSNLPQQYRLNPSYQPEYNVFIGLPGLSGISVNYLNTSFGVEDLLRKNQDSVYFDINRFYKKLRKRNFINVDNQNSILSVGVRAKSWYVTVDITERNDFMFRYNKDIFTFIKNGNIDYLGKTMDFGKMGMNGSAYLEFALGLSKKVNEKLTVGARAKYLMGIGNVDMTDSDMGVFTAADGSTMNLYSRQNIRASAPVRLKYEKDQNGYVEWDSFDVDTDNLGVSSFLNAKNPGFAMDFGGEYKLNDKIKLYASLTDLGFIRWGANNYNFYQNTTFEWQGVDAGGSINKDNDNYKELDDAFDDLLDSLKDNFRLREGAGAYVTMLNPKLYLGATYQVGKMLNVGGLFKATLVDGIFYPSLTASANARLLRNVSASVSYSIMPGNYVNLGAGITAKLGPVQLYVVTDNALGANYTKTQAVSARVGINLLFGHKDKKRKKKPEEVQPEIVIAPVPVKKDTIIRDTVIPVVPDTVPVKENVAAAVDTAKDCYVVVGSFKDEQKAEALKKTMISLGFVKSTIMPGEEDMYRVVVDSFTDRDKCWEEVFRIRKEYPQYEDSWALIVPKTE